MRISGGKKMGWIWLLVIVLSGCVSATGRKSPGSADYSQAFYKSVQFSMEPRMFDKEPLLMAPKMGGDVDETRITAYLNGIVARLMPAGAGPPPPVILTGHNGYTASASPDGSIRISSGLVRDADSEDELAAVLSHEMSHVLLGHASRIKYHDNMSDLANLCKMATSAADNLFPEDVESELIVNRIAYARSITDFITGPVWSRPQEDEADDNGMKLLINAGYAPRSMGQVMQKITTQGINDKDKWHEAMGKRFGEAVQEVMMASTKEAGSKLPGILTGKLAAGEAAESLSCDTLAKLKKRFSKTVTGSISDVRTRFSDWSSRFHKEAMVRQAQIKKKIKLLPKDLSRRKPDSESLKRLREDPRVASFLCGMASVAAARKSLLEKEMPKARKAADAALKTPAGQTPYALAILSFVAPAYLDSRLPDLIHMKKLPPVLYDMAIKRLTEKGQLEQAKALSRKGEEEYGDLFSAPIEVYWAYQTRKDQPELLDKCLNNCKLLNHEKTYSACLIAAGKPLPENKTGVDLSNVLEGGLMKGAGNFLNKLSD